MWQLVKDTVGTVVALVIVVVATPILWAMGRDLAERNARQVGELYPYDDDDAGIDVDEPREQRCPPDCECKS